MDTWKECGWAKCRKRFEPRRRSNQYQRGAQHGGAVYCSHRCRQMAYRQRVEASQKTTAARRTPSALTSASVTRPSSKGNPVASVLSSGQRKFRLPCPARSRPSYRLITHRHLETAVDRRSNRRPASVNASMMRSSVCFLGRAIFCSMQ